MAELWMSLESYLEPCTKDALFCEGAFHASYLEVNAAQKARWKTHKGIYSAIICEALAVIRA